MKDAEILFCDEKVVPVQSELKEGRTFADDLCI